MFKSGDSHASALMFKQGLYRNGKTEFKDFSRTIPGLFPFFKDSISFQFCIKQRKKCTFSAEKAEMEIEKTKKAHSFSLIPMIKTGTIAQIE